jgi:cytochrome oxidase Cu insertion factor (SCO1/SenC/PrrC family)
VQAALFIQPLGVSVKFFHFMLIFSGFALIVSACAPAQPESSVVARPDWFDMELTDVQTGKTFTMNDYTGKVVLLETMAIWCPNCVVQANEVRNLHELLGNPADLISVTLDVDFNEDEASLKEYASGYGFDWHFAVAPLLVARALGNLYTAQYLNPPLSPMLIIDRDGNVHHLEYGLKEAETLQKIVEPYLAK